MLSALLLLSAASPVTFDPPKPRLGDLLVIYLESTDAKIDQAAVQILGYEVSMHRVSAGLLRGVAAVPMDIEPKSYPVRMLAGGREHQAQITILDRAWETSELSVSSRFTKKRHPPALQARLRREAKQFADLWKRGPTAPKFAGKVQTPIPGIKTSSFGVQRVFNGKKKSTHFGLDLDGPVGQPIRPVADGRVVLSAMRWASGGTIVIDHGGGMFTLYFHLSKRLKKEGDFVRTSDIIGEVGQTGRVTGPHLHLAAVVRSVRMSGSRRGEPRSMYVDPEALLQRELKGHPAFVGPVGEVASH